MDGETIGAPSLSMHLSILSTAAGEVGGVHGGASGEGGGRTKSGGETLPRNHPKGGPRSCAPAQHVEWGLSIESEARHEKANSR